MNSLSCLIYSKTFFLKNIGRHPSAKLTSYKIEFRLELGKCVYEKMLYYTCLISTSYLAGVFDIFILLHI